MTQSVFSRATARQGPTSDGLRFDALARLLGAATSRRSIIGGMLGTLGLGAFLPVVTEAKNHKSKPKKSKKHKKSKQTPLVLNQFACVNEGGKCKGSNANCCSGVCQGKKPKNGEADKSTCIGHNVSLCTAERNLCVVSEVDASTAFCNAANPLAVCTVTTGNSNFCANFDGASEAGNCRACTRDTDCTAEGFPPGTACVQLSSTGPCSPVCAATGNRICLPPGI